MAGGGKGAGGGKSGGRAARPSGGPSRKQKTTAKKKPSSVATEIKCISAAALGVLLLLSIFFKGSVGVVGAFIRSALIGLFGFGAYALPFVLIAATAYVLFSPSKKITGSVAAVASVFFWCLLALVHVAAVKEQPEPSGLFGYFSGIYKQGGAGNGGFMGALLGNLLKAFLGGVGASVVLVTCGLIALVLLTGRTVSNILYHAALSTRDGIADQIRVRSRAAREKKSRGPAGETGDGIVSSGASGRFGQSEAPGRHDRQIAARPGWNPFARRDAPQFPPRIKKRGIASLETDWVNPEGAENYESRNQPPRREFPDSGIRYDERGVRRGIMFDLDYDGETGAGVSGGDDYELPEGAVPFETSGEGEERYYADESDAAPGEIKMRGLVDEPDFEQEDWDAPPFDSDDVYQTRPKRDFPADAFRAARDKKTEAPSDRYEFPPASLLKKNTSKNPSESRAVIMENSRILEETLKSFRVEARVIEVSIGPTVTRYEMAPGTGVKVSSIANLSNDLALSLAAQGIRIEAPIPNKSAVGIEIPNKEPQPVLLREIIEDDSFKKFPSKLAFALGKDIAGAPVVTDVASMPHLLIAGATGSGKSVCINTLITSLVYKSRPDEVKLLMIDPKVVELIVYNGIPHLMIPVVTDPKKASGALQWAVAEMEKRYALFAEVGARDIKGYNGHVGSRKRTEAEVLPQIVIIIDELADLMMMCKGEVEESICRLAQKARAAGIHLIVATQRPSVDVITGLIKANIPSRLAFAVTSGIDSRTVIDMYGAEKLLGRGDMLFLPSGQAKPVRLQGCYISDREVEDVVDFLKAQRTVEYTEEMIEQITSPSSKLSDAGDGELDEYFNEAVEFLVEKGRGSTTLLQKRFRIGYNRASRLMDDLEARGIVGPEDGVKPRKILITYSEYAANYKKG